MFNLLNTMLCMIIIMLVHSFFLSVAPAIEDLEYGLSNEGLYTITCTTFGTPPTSVTWTKNGVVISTNNSMYQFTQVLVDRNDTIYENLLTIKEMFEDAIGDYSCTAKNSLGASETVNRTIKGLYYSYVYKPYL